MLRNALRAAVAALILTPAMASDPLVLPGYHPYGPPIVIPGTRYGHPYGDYNAIWGYQDIQPGTYVPYVPYRFTAKDHAAIRALMLTVPGYRP